MHIVRRRQSEAYHDYYRWRSRTGRPSTSGARSTEWGQLFDQYVSGPPTFATPDKPQTDRARVKLGRTLALAAAAGALFYVGFAAYSGFHKVVDALEHYAWATAAGALCLAAINYLLRFFKWELYLRRLGVRIPIGDSFGIFLSGFSLTVTPGKVGEVLKSYLSARGARRADGAHRADRRGRATRPISSRWLC